MFQNYYFLGIGGIGMSALARYFKAKGFAVAGYDRTETKLTRELQNEGINICFEENVELIPTEFANPQTTLVVYTPAMAANNKLFEFFTQRNFEIHKRAQVLGQITRMERGLCVAGTHGKTTTSTMTAHILKQSHVDCNAFLGGISNNYSSNLLLSDSSDLVVIEADEFDRSFHQLSPYMAVITSTDADHLDIYGTHEAYLESFAHFTSLVVEGGTLIVKKGVALDARVANNVKVYSYSGSEKADFYANNIRLGNGRLLFDYITPTDTVADIELGVPVLINVENAVAAMTLAYLNGVTPDELRSSMASFAGIRRRFEFHLRTPQLTVIDDYAHHYKELEASLKSVNALYDDKKSVVVFQPHLYTRTRDFYVQFAQSLSIASQVVVLDIYPAREAPIEGVTSKLIYDLIASPVKRLCTKEKLVDTLKPLDFNLLLTVGAGDVDTFIPQIIEEFKK